jgi:hypothetical protein
VSVFLIRPVPGYELWSKWYQKYYDKVIFRSPRTKGDLYVSTHFSKYFVNGNIEHLGSVLRRVGNENKITTNSSFVQYCVERGIKLPSAYFVGVKNMDAGFASVAKYDKNAMPILDEDAWLISKEWTVQHFYPHMCGSRVFGGQEVIAELDMSASPGYPHNLVYASKRDFFETPWVANEHRAHPRDVCEDWWSVISGEDQENVGVVPIWSNQQKVELRTVEKLRANSLRTYTASPTEHAYACNRLCLDMNNRFYESNGRSWSFVGGTKYLNGWNSLYLRLNKHPNAYELDESQYVSSLFTRLMWDLVDIRENFWSVEDRTPLNRRRLERVYESVIHTVIVLENGELIQKHTGNPSGSSNTIVDNTINLFRLFAYAWIILCRRQGKEPVYVEFMAEVEAALNGDDNTFTCSDAVNGWFNPSTIAPIWSAIGVTTNTPDWNPRALKDVRFLSQGFSFDRKIGIWFPVPETEKVMSSLAYGACIHSYKLDDVRWHLLRANALRLDSYGNLELRRIISGYIEYLHTKHKDDMFGDVNDIPMKEILDMWRSDSWIESMYSGKEGISDAYNKLISLSALI